MVVEKERLRFQNIQINNSFQKSNYGWMCSFFVNSVCAESYSHYCSMFGSRVITPGFRVITIFVLFLSLAYNCSLMWLAWVTLWYIEDGLFGNMDTDKLKSGDHESHMQELHVRQSWLEKSSLQVQPYSPPPMSVSSVENNQHPWWLVQLLIVSAAWYDAFPKGMLAGTDRA